MTSFELTSNVITRLPLLADTTFVLTLLLQILFGVLFSYSLFLCTAINSALTTSLVGVAKSVVQTVVGFFTFGGVAFHPVNVTGLCSKTVLFLFSILILAAIKPIHKHLNVFVGEYFLSFFIIWRFSVPWASYVDWLALT